MVAAHVKSRNDHGPMYDAKGARRFSECAIFTVVLARFVYFRIHNTRTDDAYSAMRRWR